MVKINKVPIMIKAELKVVLAVLCAGLVLGVCTGVMADCPSDAALIAGIDSMMYPSQSGPVLTGKTVSYKEVDGDTIMHVMIRVQASGDPHPNESGYNDYYRRDSLGMPMTPVMQELSIGTPECGELVSGVAPTSTTTPHSWFGSYNTTYNFDITLEEDVYGDYPVMLTYGIDLDYKQPIETDVVECTVVWQIENYLGQKVFLTVPSSGNPAEDNPAVLDVSPECVRGGGPLTLTVTTTDDVPGCFDGEMYFALYNPPARTYWGYFPGGQIGSTIVDGNAQWTYSGTCITDAGIPPDGWYQLWGFNYLGGTVTWSNAFFVDNTAPVITVTADGSLEVIQPGRSQGKGNSQSANAGFRRVVLGSATATDNYDLNPVVVWNIDGIEVEDGDLVKITVDESLTENETNVISPGWAGKAEFLHIVGPTGLLRVTATDCAGNSASVSMDN